MMGNVLLMIWVPWMACQARENDKCGHACVLSSAGHLWRGRLPPALCFLLSYTCALLLAV